MRERLPTVTGSPPPPSAKRFAYLLGRQVQWRDPTSSLASLPVDDAREDHSAIALPPYGAHVTAILTGVNNLRE